MEYPKRKAIRLKEYDYSSEGMYFVTICTYERKNSFGSIVGQGLCSCRLSSIGKIIEDEIQQLELRYPSVSIDKYVIMPNHIHMILVLQNKRQEQSPCPTLGDVLCTLKSISTKRANVADHVQKRKIWQFRYHEHIIRNEHSYQEIWNYIDTNPMKWMEDCYHSN